MLGGENDDETEYQDKIWSADSKESNELRVRERSDFTKQKGEEI